MAIHIPCTEIPLQVHEVVQSTWLVVVQPLWKIWVRQLGWWHSQYMEKKKTCSKPPTSINMYRQLRIEVAWHLVFINHGACRHVSLPIFMHRTGDIHLPEYGPDQIIEHPICPAINPLVYKPCWLYANSSPWYRYIWGPWMVYHAISGHHGSMAMLAWSGPDGKPSILGYLVVWSTHHRGFGRLVQVISGTFPY